MLHEQMSDFNFCDTVVHIIVCAITVIVAIVHAHGVVPSSLANSSSRTGTPTRVTFLVPSPPKSPPAEPPSVGAPSSNSPIGSGNSYSPSFSVTSSPRVASPVQPPVIVEPPLVALPPVKPPSPQKGESREI